MNSPISEGNRRTLAHASSRMDLLIAHFGEEITLRELRVRFKVFEALLENSNEELSYGDVERLTGVNQSTIGRYLLFCIVDGCLKERIDPTDRRRRLLSMDQQGIDRMEDFLNEGQNF